MQLMQCLVHFQSLELLMSKFDKYYKLYKVFCGSIQIPTSSS